MKVFFISLRYKIAISAVLYGFIVIGVHTPLFAQSETSREYELKTSFIYNFTKYIQWSDPDTSDTFEIAVIGDSEIIVPLRELAEKRPIDDKKIIIEHYQSVQDIDQCHILFISISEENRLREILQKVKNKNILTISDSKGFANGGIAINFVLVEGKIKFEMNTRAIDSAGLQVSSQLLKLAILIKEKGKSTK